MAAILAPNSTRFLASRRRQPAGLGPATGNQSSRPPPSLRKRRAQTQRAGATPSTSAPPGSPVGASCTSCGAVFGGGGAQSSPLTQRPKSLLLQAHVACSAPSPASSVAAAAAVAVVAESVETQAAVSCHCPFWNNQATTFGAGCSERGNTWAIVAMAA